ncbi:hypothetical protein C8J27_101143 [Rhodobacter aestuarii]|uniref:Uncharacterized protein n=1 Tax=Rhodobacter aestuarii TaxID=453582 RepID=A0A1N7J9K4_9RHOB|nr:hypothetical protein C8J27_101143 [Rhodobacter aestuarii]SIS45941.1 hypothetical protein SAMN05421580_101499 [Rhodobacter aestuarii]SOB98336.1 hypothetical protein SAMN05877809_102202 [Rhodobacter sp. JA431]
MRLFGSEKGGARPEGGRNRARPWGRGGRGPACRRATRRSEAGQGGAQ